VIELSLAPVSGWGARTAAIEAGLPDPAVIEKLASDYGLHFAEAPWLPDIIARYNLTPPPG
jgi:hypothetical protein